MTPAINAAKHAKVPFNIHEYAHDPKAPSYGEEAAVKLGLPLERVFKTLVVSLDGKELAVAVVPVSGMLDMKHCAAALGGKKCDMAERKDAERSTGYVLGGISPLGQKKRLRTVIDESAQGFWPRSTSPVGVAMPTIGWISPTICCATTASIAACCAATAVRRIDASRIS